MRNIVINTIETLNNWSLVASVYDDSKRFQYNQHLIARTGYYYLAVEITKQGIELINLVGLNATKYGRVQTLSSANDVQTTPKLYKTVNGNEDKFRLNIDLPGQKIKEELVIAKTIYKVKVFATQTITTSGVWSNRVELKEVDVKELLSGYSYEGKTIEGLFCYQYANYNEFYYLDYENNLIYNNSMKLIGFFKKVV